MFSHRSKLDLIAAAHAADYVVVLHVLLIPEERAVLRVKYRVAAGGHDVPETKIRERHRRLWAIVADAMALSDTATVYDNSRLAGPRIVAQFSGGDVIGIPSWPTWTPEVLRAGWPGCLTQPKGTSSVHTLKLVNVAGPNVLLSATSAASRPRAINTLPIRGVLWRASKVCHCPPRKASNQAEKSIGSSTGGTPMSPRYPVQ